MDSWNYKARFRRGTIARVKGTVRLMKILQKDEIATRAYDKPHWKCRAINVKCEDSYPEDRLEVIRQPTKQKQES